MFIQLLEVFYSFPFNYFLVIFLSWLFLHYREYITIYWYSAIALFLLSSSLLFDPIVRWSFWFPSSSISVYTIFFLCIQELFRYSKRYLEPDLYYEHRIIFQKSIKKMTSVEEKFAAYQKAIIINKEYFRSLNILYGRYNSFFIYWLLITVSILHITFFTLDSWSVSNFTVYLEQITEHYQLLLTNLELDEKQRTLFTSFMEESVPMLVVQMNRWFILYSLIFVFFTFLLIRSLISLVLKKKFCSIGHLGTLLFFELRPSWIYVLIVSLLSSLTCYYFEVPPEYKYPIFNILGVLFFFYFLHGYSYLKLYSQVHFIPFKYFILMIILFSIFFQSFVLLGFFICTCILLSITDFWFDLRKRTLQIL